MTRLLLPLGITPLGLAILLIIMGYLCFMLGRLFEIRKNDLRDTKEMDEAEEREWRKENWNKTIQP